MSYPKSSETTVKEPDHDPLGQEKTPAKTDFNFDRSNSLSNPSRTSNPNNNGWVQIVLSILIALGLGFVGGQWWPATQKANEQPSAGRPNQSRGNAVKIASVETANLQETSEFVGTLEATQAVDMKPEIEGRITRIFGESGDVIAQGDPLFRLQSDDVEANLTEARANLARTQARLAELQAGSRPEEIAQASARVAEARARLNDAESGSLLAEINEARAQIESIRAEAQLATNRVNRFSELNEAGAISQDEFDALVSQQASQEANLNAAQRRLEQLQKNRQSEIQLRRAVVEQEQQALRQLQNGTRVEEIQQAEAEVAEAAAQVRSIEVQLQETAVLAPFTGVLGDIDVKVGDYVDRGDILTRLTANNVLELRLPIPLERKADLKLGLPVQMSDSEGKVIATGRVSFISPSVNQDSQTILAKAAFDNNNGLLKDGQFVRAEVVWKQKPNAVIVPMTAVRFQGEQRFVFVAEGNNEQLTAKQQPVKLGLIQGDRAEVLTGLRPGQNIVVSGLQKLTDGANLNPVSENSETPKKN